jgi:hypothetical protein
MSTNFRVWTAVVFAATAAVISCAGGCSKSTGGISPQEAEDLCVNIVSCEQGAGSGDRMTDCVGSLAYANEIDQVGFPMGEMVDCLRDAGRDCGKIKLCTNEGHPAQSCDAVSYQNHCEGDLQVTCSGGEVKYFDCSKLDFLYGDTQCVVDPVYDNPECVGPSCTEESLTCNGNTLEICSDGNFVRMDCGLMGAECGQLAPGVQYCIGTGPDCTDEGVRHCDGSRIVTCMGGKEAAADCAELIGHDFTCGIPPDESEVGCVPSATLCNNDYTDHCDGNVIVYCRAGSLDRADCTSYGYTSCVQGESGPYCQ